jgi:small-conductance mechanosensitive channel
VSLAFASPNVSAQNQEIRDRPSETSEPQKEVVIEPRAQDIEIASRLEKILGATGWFSSPRVSVREGVVFLDGAAATGEQREWAGNLARKTQDVVAVVNRLQVEPKIDWGLEPAYSEVKTLAQRTVSILPLAILGAGILLLTAWIAYLTANVSRRVLKSRIRSPLLLSVVARAIAVPLFLLGLYLVLQVAGLTRLAITVLGGTGVLGIVLGFAFRDIAENFLASLLLSIRNPFRTGDLIGIADNQGIVQSLNTRTTVLLTLDGNQIQIPNATVYKSTLTNYTRNPTRRADFVIPLATNATVRKAQAIALDVLRSEPAICSSPEPLVLVDKVDADRIELRIYFWFDSSIFSPIKLRSALMRRCRRALLDADVQLPAPLPPVVLRTAQEKHKPAQPSDFAAAAVEDISQEAPQVSALASAPADPADSINLLEDERSAVAAQDITEAKQDKS